jgi:hypothetical protein
MTSEKTVEIVVLGEDIDYGSDIPDAYIKAAGTAHNWAYSVAWYDAVYGGWWNPEYCFV